MVVSSPKHGFRTPRKLGVRFRPRLETLEDRTLLSVCTVEWLTDNNPAGGGEGGNGMGDLRWCIIESLSTADTINFGVTGTINLAAALPNMTRSVSIEGPGANLMTVRRGTGGSYHIFTVATGTTASISSLTISNGSGNVGGILNSGVLMLSNSTISGNTANYGVGGIYNNGGTLTITNSTISENNTYRSLGAVKNSGTLTITNSTISDNNATQGVAGISNSGTLMLSNSTISGNFASGAIGGGISNQGTLTVTNSTISGNYAENSGGGISNSGTLTVRNSTIAGNSSLGQGGGIFNGYLVAARNTIIAGNNGHAGGPDVYGNLGSQGHNLIGNIQDGSGFHETDLLNVNPQLGLLQANGGPTRTMALLPGSPAVDAGDNAEAPDFDQRGEGFPRIVGDYIDIGSYEAQIGSAISFRIDAPNSVPSGMPFDITVTALDSYNHVATGYTGTVIFSTTDLEKGVVLPADYTFMPEEGGVHKFTDTGLGETTLITPGDQTIHVRDTTDDSIKGSANVTVTGGDAPRMGASTRKRTTRPPYTFLTELNAIGAVGANPPTNRIYFASGSDLHMRDGNSHEILATIPGVATGSIGFNTNRNRRLDQFFGSGSKERQENMLKNPVQEVLGVDEAWFVADWILPLPKQF